MNMTKSLIVHFPDAQSRKSFASNFDAMYYFAEADRANHPTLGHWDTYIEAYMGGEITKEFVD